MFKDTNSLNLNMYDISFSTFILVWYIVCLKAKQVLSFENEMFDSYNFGV